MNQSIEPWPLWRIRLAYLGRRAIRVFWLGDTTTIRAVMLVSSVLFAVGLLTPLKTFERPSWAVMGQLAPGWVWTAAFLLHAAGLTWRFIDPTLRGGWAFAINAFGWSIWSIYVWLTTVFVGEYTPSTAMEITVLLAAFVALCRTGLNEEAISA